MKQSTDSSNTDLQFAIETMEPLIVLSASGLCGAAIQELAYCVTDDACGSDDAKSDDCAPAKGACDSGSKDFGGKYYDQADSGKASDGKDASFACLVPEKAKSFDKAPAVDEGVSKFVTDNDSIDSLKGLELTKDQPIQDAGNTSSLIADVEELVEALKSTNDSPANDVAPASFVFSPTINIQGDGNQLIFNVDTGLQSAATPSNSGGVVDTSSLSDLSFSDLKQQIKDFLAGGAGDDKLADPVVADPVVTDPVVTDPVVTDPVVTDPVVTDPVVTDPVVTDPVVTDPVVTDPVVTDPVVTDPVVTDPVVTDPVVTDPVVTDPVVTDPVVTDPVVTDPVVTDPVVTDPVVTDPVVTDPVVTDPVVTDPVVTDPVVTDPVVTDPVVTDPVVTDPVVTDPVVTDPVVTDPVVTDPVVTDPVVTDPVVTDPVVTDPVVTDPVVTDPVEMPIEDVAKFNDDFRAIDGTGNNLDDILLGSTDTELLRLAPADYGDGLNTLAGDDRPSAREISNGVSDQVVGIENEKGLSDFLWAWGQFIDHDIDLSLTGSGEDASIPVPKGDPHFDPAATGDATIAFERSANEVDDYGVRQQLNDITSYIDASQVYGSDAETQEELRLGEGGRMILEDNYLPTGVGEDGQGGFIAGDIRAGENIVLTSMHTLFAREHNRIAADLAANEYADADMKDPAIDDEIYLRTRAIVGGMMQKITYDEFLPALLGEDGMSEYKGYDSSVDPRIANEFSTAAFRVGHTMLSPELMRLNPDGTVAAEGNIALRDAFFSKDALLETGISEVLQGAAAQTSQKIDPYIIDDVRNFLFGAPGSGGLDLASLNIQRGRDHGLSSFNDTREALGLDRYTCFEDISSDPDVVKRLSETYDHVDDIDLWVGGLSEDHVGKGTVGSTFSEIISDQFERLRDGDRYYYKSALSATDLEYVDNTKLSDIIRRNSDADTVQDDVFRVVQKNDYYA